MIRAWRITHSRFVNSAFDGEGAYLYGGRWNNPGHRMVYVSGSLALAALELLVNGIQPHEVNQFISIPVDMPKKIVKKLDLKTLPPDWADSPAPDETKAIGDTWLAAKKSAALQVPSAVIPDESNYLINSLHQNFNEFKIGHARPFSFDQRLL